MKQDEIIEELDKLKLKIMLDIGTKLPSDLESYVEWIDEMQMRGVFSLKPWKQKSNERYAKFSLLKSLVDDLYYKKHGDAIEYHRDRPDIRRMIAEIVSMVMFCQDELLT